MQLSDWNWIRTMIDKGTVRNWIAFLAIAFTVTQAISSGQRHVDALPGDDAAIVHVLNRVAFGPAPGDVDRLRRMGVAAYIDEQLNPEHLANDQLAARLSGFTTLSLSTRELAEQYFIPGMIRRREAQRTTGDPLTAREPNGRNEERRVLAELTQQKMLRAVYSERQLEEVMVDFWFNHFNVFAGKGSTRLYLTAYERDTIRPRVFGKFRDLLGAVAESPAMLFYLDNWQSAAADDAERTVPGRRRPGFKPASPQNRRRGLNENYARELLELHTLGVDGGYTQKDVQEVARAFTGWTIEFPRQGGHFRFDPRIHDSGEKMVLGTRMPRGGGKSDGDRVLDLVSRHPSTARFISAKLARRFVSDTPSPALVDRAAAAFTKSDGDIRQVVRTILTSPEFFAAESRRAKIKTPLEFVVSAVRASGLNVRDAQPLVAAMRQLGMPLYLCQPPIGYSDTADAWVNTGALLNRMNFAVSLTTNRVWIGQDAPLVARERIASEILAGQITPATRATVAKAANERQAVALLLGSPDFQKR